MMKRENSCYTAGLDCITDPKLVLFFPASLLWSFRGTLGVLCSIMALWWASPQMAEKSAAKQKSLEFILSSLTTLNGLTTS